MLLCAIVFWILVGLLYMAFIVGGVILIAPFAIFKGVRDAIKNPHPIDIVDYFAERNKKKGK